MKPGRARARTCRPLFFNPENGSTTILKKTMGDTGVPRSSDLQNEPGESRTSDTGDTPLSVSPAGKPAYEVKWDTLGRFTPGQEITGSEYGSVKEEYDVRMKDWTGAGLASGDGIYHISGGKRDQVKRFIEEKRYVVTSEFYHYIIRAQGKKVDPIAISRGIQDKGLKFIWVHVLGQAGPEKVPRRMRLNRL
jgi:hypothetical protein